MDRPESRQAAPARPVPRPNPRKIGFIGKSSITAYEAACLEYIGKCLAQIGHSLVLVPAKGSAAAMRVGVEAREGKVHEVQSGVLDQADRILIYPDTRLFQRLEQTYPDITERENVVFIYPNQLDEWVRAMKEILNDYGIALP